MMSPRAQKRRTRLSVAIAVLCCLTILIGSLAFFTDRFSSGLSAKAGNMDLIFTDISASKDGTNSITSPNEFAINKSWKNEALVSVGNIINPGDYFDLSYTLANKGNKSVDVRQQLTVTSSVPMNAIEGYTLTIIGENYNTTAIAGTLSDDGLTLTYNLDDIILNGTGIGAEIEDGVSWTEQTYIVRLDFNALTGNDFQGANMGVKLDIQAKQHRNTNDNLWASWAEYETKFEQIVNDNDAPVLTVLTPESTSSAAPTYVENATYTISGTVVDDSGIKSLTVNNVEVSVNADGTWSTNMTLTKGRMAKIVVVAVDNNNNTTTETRYVTYIEPTAFAIYSAADKSLTFYKNTDYSSITTGSTYNGKSVTAKYTGFETATYLQANKVPWKYYVSSIASVSFEDEISPKSTAYWFCNFTACTSINLENLNTSSVTKMSSMFAGCSSLTELDLSNFDTSSVTDMNAMFYTCTSLLTLDVAHFDTSSVTNMSAMFVGCSSLTELDLSNFDTSSVTDMTGMFNACSGLTTLDVSNFVTSSVTNMRNMFTNCTNLPTLDIAHFDTSSVTDMNYMFFGCSSLTELDVSNFVTNKVTRMEAMFNGCKKLTTLDVSTWNTSSVTTMYQMFNNCSKLATLDTSNWDTSKVTNMNSMFSGCSSLTELDVSNFDTSIVTNMGAMFMGCKKITTLNVSNFVTSSVTDMSSMFSGCSSLTELDVSNWDTSSVTNMYSTFRDCSSLATDCSMWDVTNVTKRDYFVSNAPGVITPNF